MTGSDQLMLMPNVGFSKYSINSVQCVKIHIKDVRYCIRDMHENYA